mmetsp:Transcript_98903/g.155925  ORF Transcript_98903/g.155925 Transcript_98903/m.155925 type:complete len:458 (+) Transcript_98903:93-1466(+)
MACDAPVSEETSLLKRQNKKRGWASQRITIVVVNAIVYLVGIMPLALPSPLAPTFEMDLSLGWTKHDTKLFLSRTLLLEGVGVLCLGWLPDHIGGSISMTAYLVIAAAFLALISAIDDPSTIIGLWSCLGFVRGISWPAAMKITSDYLAGSQWLVSICMVGMASRVGDALTAEFFAMFVGRHGWRSAIVIVSIAQFVGAICLMIASGIHPVADGSAADVPSRSSLSLEGLDTSPSVISRVKAFYSMPDTWLMQLMAACQQPFWILCGYLASFAHGIYFTDSSTSALVQGLYPAGQFVGLACALICTLAMGESMKQIYGACVFLSLVSAIIPLFLRFCPLPLEGFAAFTALEGFSVVLIDYIPATVWCMHVGQRSGDSSLFMGIMFGITFMVGYIGSNAVGHLRTVREELALNTSLSMAVASGFICALLLIMHIPRQLHKIRQLPGGLVYDEVQTVTA